MKRSRDHKDQQKNLPHSLIQKYTVPTQDVAAENSNEGTGEHAQAGSNKENVSCYVKKRQSKRLSERLPQCLKSCQALVSGWSATKTLFGIRGGSWHSSLSLEVKKERMKSQSIYVRMMRGKQF